MKRFPFPAAILALALPTAGAAESIDPSSSDFVARISETLGDPLATDGFEPAAFHADVGAEPGPARAVAVDVHFGARPKAGEPASAAEPGDARGRLPALVRFDTAGPSAETEARATVTVTRGGATAAGDDVGLARFLADLCGFGPRRPEVIEDDPRVDLPLPAKF